MLKWYACTIARAKYFASGFLYQNVVRANMCLRVCVCGRINACNIILKAYQATLYVLALQRKRAIPSVQSLNLQSLDWNWNISECMKSSIWFVEISNQKSQWKWSVRAFHISKTYKLEKHSQQNQLYLAIDLYSDERMCLCVLFLLFLARDKNKYFTLSTVRVACGIF